MLACQMPPADGHSSSNQITAWVPSPDELRLLNDGGSVIITPDPNTPKLVVMEKIKSTRCPSCYDIVLPLLSTLCSYQNCPCKQS